MPLYALRGRFASRASFGLNGPVALSEESATNAASIAAFVFGHPARALVVRYVSANPGVVFGQIYDYVAPRYEASEGKAFIRPTLTKHIHVLEDCGVLTNDLPEELRRGRSPKYSVDDKRAQALIRAFVDSLSADTESSTSTSRSRP